MSDEIDIDECREMAMKLQYPDYCLMSTITLGEAVGFVTWDANPPVNVGYQTHKFSLIDAFETGACFMRTDFVDDWLVLGPVASSVVVTLPQFIMADNVERTNAMLKPIGKLGRWKVHAWPEMMEPCEFYMGHGTSHVRGLVLHGCLPSSTQPMNGGDV